jgi:hypothetical protein
MTTQLLALYMLFLAAATFGVMLYQQTTGKHGLLTLRNFALVGFIVFQLTGSFGALWVGRDSRYNLDWEAVGLEYALYATVFLLVFFPAYHWGAGAKRLAKWTPTTSVIPGPSTMFLLALMFTILAVVLRLSVNIPYVSMIASRAGIGFAAVAVGFTAWVWIRNIWNPVYLFWFGFITMANLSLILSQSFGRRNLIALGAAGMWAMYYASLRHMNPRRLVVALTIVSLPPVLLVAAFTSVRSSEEGRVDLGRQVVNILTQADIKTGLLELAAGQDCAVVGMWTMENFPERYEYDHLLAIKYFFYLPIPRAIWEEKPLPLGKRQPELANLEGVDTEKLTTGPGVIGHAAAEGGLYALVIYAIVGALFLRYFDEVVARNAANPFVVMPIGSALGQIVGLPRGDLSLFAASNLVAVVGVYIVTVSLAKFLGLIRGPDMEAIHSVSGEDWPEPGPDADLDDLANYDADAYARGDDLGERSA